MMKKVEPRFPLLALMLALTSCTSDPATHPETDAGSSDSGTMSEPDGVESMEGFGVDFADPKATFGKLARHLLMRPAEAQLAEAIELSSFERLQKQEAEGGFKERPKVSKQFFRKGETGQWKTALTQGQIERIIAAHHVQMRRFGYLADGA